MKEITKVFLDGSVDDSLEMVLDEADERGRINVVYIGQGEDDLRFNYKIIQRAPGTLGEIYVYGILLGKAVKDLTATVEFSKGAKGARGKVYEKVMLLSDEVVNISRPVMLCGEEDVRGEHGASVGHLEPTELRYLMARGVSLARAREILTMAVLRQVLDKISDTKILGVVRERLSGVKLEYDREDVE